MVKYQRLANAVAAVHLFWILVLNIGIVLALILPWYRNIQLIVVTATVTSQLLMKFRCPLTKIEVYLRRKIDPDY